MKKFLLIPFFGILFSLQGCSWICRFYIINTTNEVITVELKLQDSPGSFPIFYYPFHSYGKIRQYKLKKNGQVNYESASEVKADTLDKYSHFTVHIQPHSAIEIGYLSNDTYKKYDQYFINDRKFNLEKLSISQKKVEIVPATFDNYFRKRRNGGVYFVL